MSRLHPSSAAIPQVDVLCYGDSNSAWKHCDFQQADFIAQSFRVHGFGRRNRVFLRFGHRQLNLHLLLSSMQLFNEQVRRVANGKRQIVRWPNFPSTLGQRSPVHSVHARTEMLGRHQPAELVEYFCAFVEGQVHCVLIPMGVDVSPIAINAAQ